MARTKKSKPNQSRNTLLIYLSLIVAGLLLAAIAYLRPQPLQIAEIKNESGTVDLSFSPNTLTLKPNESATVQVAYSSGETHFTAVHTEISYDPTLFELSSPTLHPSFPTHFIAPKIESGKLTFAVGVATGANTGVTGNGHVLTFTLKALKVGNANLGFSAETLATTTESPTNSLRSLSSLSVEVAEPVTITTSPSPSPNDTICTQIAGTCLNSSGTCTTYTDGCQHAERCATPVTQCNLTSPSPSPSTPSVTKPNSPTNLKYNCYNNGTRITLRWDSVSQVDGYETVLDQKDGDADKSQTSARSELDLDIKPNTPYTWKLASLRSGLKSDYVTLNDLKCSGEQNQNSQSPNPPTPAPTPSPTVTPSPSKKPLTQQLSEVFKKPSPTPLSTPTKVYPTSTPSSDPGSLADIFVEPTPAGSANPVAEPSLISKIFLGWQALFYRFLESLAR